MTRRMLLARTFLLLASLWSYVRADCAITVSSEEFSCESIMPSVGEATCDGCYLFCGSAYSKCVTSLDEAECEGDLVASVCGDEQRPDGEGGGTVDITDGTQTSSATRRATASVPLALLLLAPGMMGVAVALEALR